MALKFCANLNFLFTENGASLAEKYILAYRAGFKGVESPCPVGLSLDEVTKVKNETGLEQVLLNLSTKGTADIESVCAAHPNAKEQFRMNLNETVKAAKILKCRKIHVIAGMTVGEDRSKQWAMYLENLKYAAKILEKENILGVIEPINKYAVPGYFLNSYPEAIKILDEVNSPNLKLMIDIFHLQHIQGNITNTLNELKSYIGHIQIAQVPHRHEPNEPGELDYAYIFKTIEGSGYADWIGCEYKPKNGTVEGLGWIKQFGYSF